MHWKMGKTVEMETGSIGFNLFEDTALLWKVPASETHGLQSNMHYFR